ncbi:predicted protein [Histoplasma capsulatum var. duboisii H88]|uniref:Predicted protein n=2 Tax=Ajellomyces capsulatus TaxID=5037 RepID=F0UVM6_AJEC8|nr:predicted protein [Histoplasma capsulatum H143]EGC49953.1 predicted protein [Histoplasma capsulatum var. duboisii H88]
MFFTPSGNKTFYGTEMFLKLKQTNKARRPAVASCRGKDDGGRDLVVFFCASTAGQICRIVSPRPVFPREAESLFVTGVPLRLGRDRRDRGTLSEHGLSAHEQLVIGGVQGYPKINELPIRTWGERSGIVERWG